MAEHHLVHQNGDRLFVTSLDISNRFGRQHKDVLQAIRDIDCSEDFGRRNFTPSSYNNSQNKRQPMFEISRDGFVFLCMGFTGPQAALWKERYILAFNEMETALRNTPAPAPLPEVIRSPRLEAQMATLSSHMGELAQGIKTVLTQLDMTKKYIGLLEINQAGTRKVTGEVAREARRLKADGMNNADIGRLLRISRTSVSLIVRDKYPVAIPERPAERAVDVGAILENWIGREQTRLSLEGGAS